MRLPGAHLFTLWMNLSSPHVSQSTLSGCFLPPAAMSVMNFFETSLRPARPPLSSYTSAAHRVLGSTVSTSTFIIITFFKAA